MSNAKKLPIVYSCSGCSSAAQLANFIALQLDRAGIGEMSCIAGVGGDVKSLVAKAKSAEEIIAIDGCPLNCTRACLSRHGLVPTTHYQMSDFKVPKKMHQDFDLDQARQILEAILQDIKTRPGAGGKNSG